MAILQEKNTKILTASIIIATYKRLNLALNLANKIKKIYPLIEIIIVDQENLHSPVNKINKLHIKYFNLDKANLAQARNFGVLKASGDVVIFFDDDVEITKDIISQHLNSYTDLTIVGVAGRVINDRDVIPEHINVDTGKTDYLGRKFISKFWSTKKQLVDFPYGCNMSFKKNILKKIGGFDPYFSKIFDEIDLSKRVKKFGKIIFQPKALVYHHKAQTGGIRLKEKLKKQQLIFKNYGYYLAKNVLFPLSLISLLLRTRTALKESKNALISLYKGYLTHLFKPINILVALILFGSIFLHFWKIPKNFIFDIDTEYQALLAKTIVEDFHIIWIGVSASNLGYYLGPGLVYLSALLLFISKGDPIIFGYFASLIGIVTLLSLYYVVNLLFDQKTAIISMIIYGFSSYIVFYDRKFWPIFIPLIAIWMFYSLVKSRDDHRWLILSIILIAFSYHIHLSLWIFWPFIIWTFFKPFKKINVITWISSIISFLTIIFPLIVFDYVHNFDNLLMPIRFIQNLSKIHPAVTGAHFAYLWSLTNKAIYLHYQNSQFISIILSIFIILALLSLLKNNKVLPHNLLIGVIFVFVILFSFYPGPIQEYYIVLLFPFLAVAISLFLKQLIPIITIPALFLFVIINSYNSLLFNNVTGLNIKKDFIKLTSNNLSSDYYLAFDGDRDYEGWRYLFEAYGKKPSQSQADQMFGWIYPQDISTNKPPLKLIVSFNNNLLSADKLIKKINVGTFYGYILKN